MNEKYREVLLHMAGSTAIAAGGIIAITTVVVLAKLMVYLVRW